VVAVQQTLESLDYVTATAVSSPAAETVILATDAVTPGIPSDLPNQPAGTPWLTTRPVIIKVSLNITEGTSGTAFVVRCRQGNSTGGTQVGSSITQTLAAAASGTFSFVFRDTNPVPGGGQYCITVAETGASVAGTVNAIDIEVLQ
jgi:hypothetical protein